MPPLRSRTVTHGRNMAGARALLRATGVAREDLGKPIVAFKVGRSEAGVRSAVSHTGALAGADRMYDALFRQLGVRRAQTFADLLEVPATLAQRRLLRHTGPTLRRWRPPRPMWPPAPTNAPKSHTSSKAPPVSRPENSVR